MLAADDINAIHAKSHPLIPRHFDFSGSGESHDSHTNSGAERRAVFPITPSSHHERSDQSSNKYKGDMSHFKGVVVDRVMNIYFFLLTSYGHLKKKKPPSQKKARIPDKTREEKRLKVK